MERHYSVDGRVTAKIKTFAIDALPASLGESIREAGNICDDTRTGAQPTDARRLSLNMSDSG